MKGEVFVCKNCGTEFGKWQGSCAACGEWNSLQRVVENQRIGKKARSGMSVNSIKAETLNVKTTTKRILSGIGEFDRVLGTGFVRGQVLLFGGEPGVGKSTILTQVISKVGGVYVTGEESPEQVGVRINRLQVEPKNIEILPVVEVGEIVGFLEKQIRGEGCLVVIDSIQTIYSEDKEGSSGSINQIKEVSARLIEVAKRLGLVMIIVGHVTKEGEIAGPKILEHMVDTVLYFEGEKGEELRLLRCQKNRFGPTEEVGVFRMEEGGLVEVLGNELLEEGEGKPRPGAVQTIIIEGSRPMLLEIQALVTESFSPMPRRVFSGFDFNRGQLLLAVCQKALKIPLFKYDVYLAVSGGVRITETGADLAMVAAVWSSYTGKTIPTTKLLAGELSLLGEVKRVKNWERRKQVAKSLGREFATVGRVEEIGKLL